MINNVSTTLRFSGLATGMDTQSIVNQLMSVDKMPLNKLYQKKQMIEWRQQDYRDITSSLRAFKDEYFNIAKINTNMLSQNAYKKYKVTSTDNSVVTATGTTAAITGTNTIRVDYLATQATVKGNANYGVSKSIDASDLADFNALEGKTLKIQVDGVEKTVVLDASITDSASLQAKLDQVFGFGKIEVTDTNGEEPGELIKISAVSGSGTHSISIDSSSTALTALGFSTSSNLSNRINTGFSLNDLAQKMNTAFSFDEDDNIHFSVNGKDFTFNKTETLQTVMNKINSDPDAKVEMRYDEVTDTFSMKAYEYGSGNTLSFEDASGSNFFASLGLDSVGDDAVSVTAGEDASVFLNGQTLIRSSNTFIVGGVQYTLNKQSSTEQKVGLELDVDSVYDGIKGFVDKYNELLDKLNGKLNEKYDRNYLPLTDEQKESMSEEEVEKWEKQAKTGLLRNDSLLSNIVSKMRRALQDSVSGLTGVLADIGITSPNYTDRGKLKIDENQLKAAIRSNPDQVMNMLSKSSDSYSSNYRGLTADEKMTRYNEEGMFYRLFDIIEDNISTVRDIGNQRGALLEKAGVIGESSEYSNLLYGSIKNYNDQITSFTARLYKKEESYYAKFTAMEKAISKMNSQYSWFASQMGTATG